MERTRHRTLHRTLGAVVGALALVLALLGAMTGSAVAESPGGSAPQARDAVAGVATARATSHKSASAYDVSTPYFNGYKKKLRAYKFTVYGRWLPKCDGKYCWRGPCVTDCNDHIGSNDAARIRFSDAVSFKKMAITNYGACGTKYYRKAKRFSSGSFEDAYAGVNDEIVTSWVHTWWNGETVLNQGTCKSDLLPTTSGGAGGAGGSGGYKHYADNKGRAFKLDVWVNPLPSRGRCYDRLYVKGGYTHTWTDDSLTWSVGYPWSIGVGVSSSSGQLTVWQDTDGDKDPQLKTPRMCKH